jgi:energy-coupling factor transporter ATP-binding protein EcfA2
MVRLEGVSFRYRGAAQEALCGVDLHVEAGECVLVAGRSGCGKSTLLYILNGLIPHLSNGDLAGTVAVGDVVPGQVPLQELSRRVGTVFQNPDNQLFMLTVADDAAWSRQHIALYRQLFGVGA